MKKSIHSWTESIKLFAWDLDGTLYPPSQELSDYIHEQVMLGIANKMDCSTNEAKDVFAKHYSKLHSTTKTLDAVGLDGTQFFLDIWKHHDLSAYIKPNPGLATAFEQAKHRLPFKHVIHTNSNTLETVKKKLGLIGLDNSLFDEVYTSVAVGHHKPSHQMFEVLWKDNKLQPGQIAYVGDREHTDISPAKELEMKTVLISNSRKKTAADYQAPSAEDLLKMLSFSS